MAQKLIKKGYTKVFALRGGWNEWLAAEYPLEKRDLLPEEQEAGETETSAESDEEAKEADEKTE